MKLFLPLVILGVASAFPQDDVLFRSGVSLVRVDAEAIDGHGRVVAGLTKDDFRVLDESREQTVVNFSYEDEPLDLILLFDTAGSMRGKLLNVVRATELGFHELRKGDRVCVRAFGAFSSEILPFTDNLQTVNEAILIQVLKLRFGGGSRLAPAATEAALRFRGEPKTHRKRAVLVITDKTPSPEPNETAAVRLLWSSDAVLSELIIDHQAQTNATNIVDNTGGVTIAAGDPGEAFRDSVRYLRGGYTMFYRLPDASPGSERRLQVKLTPEAEKRLPDVSIRARSGYTVPLQPAK